MPARERPSRRRSVRTELLAVLATALVLSACGTPNEQPLPDPPPARSGLFLSLGGDAKGLYNVDTATGAATSVGAGSTGTTSEGPGLAPSGDQARLFGTNDFELRTINADGSGWAPVGGQFAFTEGLAYDHVKAVLYASSNGFLHLRSPTTGETWETWHSPPNQPDIEGLALDPTSRILYGLARGHSDQPQFQQELYALNVEAVTPAWTAVGSTGGQWENAGLAFDAAEGVLYATGRQGDPGALYRIDRDTGAATRVGSTGLDSAAGGLAWVGAE